MLRIHSRRTVNDVLNQLDRFDRIRAPLLHWFSRTSGGLLERAASRRCWFSVGPEMLAGAKGMNVVAAMPTDRVVLETDGPFAQVRREGLNPWDIIEAIGSVARAWGVSAEAAGHQIEASEKSLVTRVSDQLGSGPIR